MSRILAWRGRGALAPVDEEEPQATWALAVGLVYLFRTRPGHRMLRELEAAVRRYAKDPAALWRLVQRGEEVIDAEAPRKRLP